MADDGGIKAKVKEQIQNVRPERFHCSPHASYGLLGHFETAVRILAAVAGILSLMSVQMGVQTEQYLRGPRLGIIVVVAALILWHLFIPIQRFKEGELTAFFLALFQLAATLLLLFGELFGGEPGPWAFGYGFLHMLADVIKLLFLYLRHDWRVAWFNHKALIVITNVEMAAHVAIWVLQVIIWLTSYVDIGPN